jgi:hypothetical protein
METAITSVVTGAFLPAPTQAGSGSTASKAFSWTLFEATSPPQAGGGSSDTKALALQVLEPSSPPRPDVGLTLRRPLSRLVQEPKRQDVVCRFLSELTLISGGVSLKKLPSRVLEGWTTQHFVTEFLSTLTLTKSSFTGTNILSTKLFETAAREARHIYWVAPNIVADYGASQRIFDAIQALYLSHNRPRNRQIATRLTALYRTALEEDEAIRPASITQFKNFFLANPDLGLPKITLTPDGTLRARWIQGPGNFVAIEFTGEPNAKLVAEIPRDNGLIATHFGSEPLENIVEIAQGMGASFAHDRA